MTRRFSRRFAIACAMPAAIAGILTAATPAQATLPGIPIQPGEVFVGSLFTASPAVIQVVCVGPTNFGHLLAGQSVEVAGGPQSQTSGTPGFTGSQATEIIATLTYTTGTGTVTIPVATFTQYFAKLPIPTAVNGPAPCGGSGVLTFTPYPLGSGRPSTVTVGFQDLGF